MKNNTGASDQFALVTGASRGIGKAIARELASRNYNLILAALPESNLETVTKEICGAYNVQVVQFEVDLTAADGPQQLFDWVKKNGFQVSVLVNNAGMGHEGEFGCMPWPDINTMMQLNMNAVVQLTYLFLPELKKCRQAYILNVGSLASFRPIPFKIIYTASKSFVFFFTRALREELLLSPVSVSVLCPGPVLTNNDTIKRTRSKGTIARMMVLRSKQVAQIAIDDLLDKKPVIVPGRFNRFLLLFEKMVPRNRQMKILAKIYKDSME